MRVSPRSNTEALRTVSQREEFGEQIQFAGIVARVVPKVRSRSIVTGITKFVARIVLGVIARAIAKMSLFVVIHRPLSCAWVFGRFISWSLLHILSVIFFRDPFILRSLLSTVREQQPDAAPY